MDGREDYARLCRVCSIWILPVVPKRLTNRILHICQTVEEMSDGHAKPIGLMPNALMDSWMLCLRDGCPPPRGQNAMWLLYVLLTRTMSHAQKMEILETDFGIKTTREIEEMYTYDDYREDLIRQEGKIEGRKEGKIEGRKEGKDETLLQIYTNMKSANCHDGYICSMMGISSYKLRQIKKMVQQQ